MPGWFNYARQVERLIEGNDISGLITHMNTSGAWAAALALLHDKDEAASEVLLSTAFGYLLLRAEPKRVAHWPLKPLTHNQGQPSAGRYVLHVADTSSTHILAFKLQSSPAEQLSDALDQLVKHKELVKHGCTGLYSVLVFDLSTGALHVIENALTELQVAAILKDKEGNARGSTSQTE